MNRPRITVVTPSFNQGDFIEQTILSVLGQLYNNLQYIVIDGGSTDATKSILEKYSADLDFWTSAPDGGQAEAINRGMAMADGDLLCWLNSDDFFLPGTLDAVAEAFTGDCDFVYGDAISFAHVGKRCVINRPPRHDPQLLEILDYIVQPAAFWSKNLWRRVGNLDESLHYAFDWDWFLRASACAAFHKLDRILSAYRFHHGHKSSRGGDARALEIVEVSRRHGSPGVRMHYDTARGRERTLRVFEHLCRKLEGRGFKKPERLARWICPGLWSLPANCDPKTLRLCAGMLGL